MPDGERPQPQRAGGPRTAIRIVVVWLLTAGALHLLSAMLPGFAIEGRGQRAPGGRADRPRQRAGVAAADPRRAAVHRPDPRPRRPRPERRGDARGLADRARDARGRPRHGHRGRRRRHRHQHPRHRAARDRRRRLLLPQRAQARGPPPGRAGGFRRARRLLPRDRRARTRASSSARSATATCPRSPRWIRDGSHRLLAWETDWSSQTGACQAGLLHGSNDDMPAFRWWEKEHGRAIVTNHPKDAAEIERRHSDGRGLLHADGASRANILSGDAPAHAADHEHGARPRAPGSAGPGLLRVLLEPLQRHPDDRARHRRHRPGALLRRAAAPPRHPPADQALLLLRARARMGDGDPARPPGGGRDRRPLRGAPGRVHDLPGLRRGRASLGRRAGRRPGRRCAGSTGRSRGSPPPPRMPPGRTTWSSSPTTGNPRARPSSTATGRPSRTSSRRRARRSRSRRRTRTATSRSRYLGAGLTEASGGEGRARPERTGGDARQARGRRGRAWRRAPPATASERPTMAQSSRSCP